MDYAKALADAVAELRASRAKRDALTVTAAKALADAVAELRAAKEKRDALIVKATKTGLSRRETARLTGLSPQRVQQVVEEAKQRRSRRVR